MVVVGLWVAIIGYTMVYAGAKKLSGVPCGLGQALTGACSGSPATTPATGGPSKQDGHCRSCAQKKQMKFLSGLGVPAVR